MYFCSPEECNDPFDSKTFYSFPNNIEKWANFILFALTPFRQSISISGEQLKAFTEYLCAKCPLTFDDTMSINLFDDFKTSSQEDKKIKEILSNQIPAISKIYKPSTRYFVSFSKDWKELLMWSHYADKHKGFCLIFKSINKAIKQFGFKKKRQIRRKTPNAFAKEMSYEMPEEFKLIDIEYLGKVNPSDAFLHMPVAVSGEAENDEHRDRIRKEQESHYKQKGESWKYENEARLILSPPPPWLFREHFEYTSQERLFHYDPSHLVGIIYGSRMKEDEKERIREILKERKEWDLYYPNYKRTDFNFVEFNATLSSNERIVNINPISILSYNRILKSDKEFERLYKEWQEGWGIEKDGSTSKRIRVA